VFLGSALSLGQQLDWFRSDIIIWLMILGGVIVPFFVIQSRASATPVIDFTLFKNIHFSFAMLILAFLFSAYFGMLILLSLWLKLYVNYTPDWIAMLLFIMILGAWIPAFLYYERYDPRIPLSIALFFFALSCFYTTNFNVDINFGRVATSRLLAGFGLVLFLPPIFRLSMGTHPMEKTIECATVFQVIRLLGCGLGAILYTTLWQRRQVFYHERLGSKLTAFSHQTHQFFQNAMSFNLEGKKSLAQLNVFLDRQATALALEDCFYFMGWVMVFLLFLLFAIWYFYPKIKFNDAPPTAVVPTLSTASSE
jgi:DHA2 family multidrug resistance protein